MGVGAMAAGALVLWSTRQGAAISPDSATYVAGARNLAAGRGYSDYGLTAITDWPPGLSLLLAAAQELGSSALTAARWINAAALTGVVVCTFMLARRYVSRPLLALAAALAAGAAPALVGVFGFVWSEPVFCVLVLAVLLLLERIGRTAAADPWLIVATGLVCGVAFCVRYAGMVLIVLAVLSVAVAALGSPPATILRRAGLALACGAFVPAIVVGRNLTHGSLTGQRLPSTETIGAFVRVADTTLSSWIVAGHHVPARPGALVIAAVLAVAAIGLTLRVRADGVRSPASAALFPLVAFVVGYALYIAVTEFQTQIDPPDDRICSPLLAPATIVLVIALEAIAGHPRLRARRWVMPAVVLALAAWIGVACATSLVRGTTDGGQGVRFSADGVVTPHWTDSALAAGLRSLPDGATVFSNQPGGLYLSSGRQPSLYAGEPLAEPPIPEAVQVAWLRRQIAARPGPTYLAWVLPNRRPNLVPPAYLAAHGVRLERVLTTPDGTIDRIVAVTP